MGRAYACSQGPGSWVLFQPVCIPRLGSWGQACNYQEQRAEGPACFQWPHDILCAQEAGRDGTFTHWGN